MGKRLGADVFRMQALLERSIISVRPFSGPVRGSAVAQDTLRSYEEAEKLANVLNIVITLFRLRNHASLHRQCQAG